MIVVGYSGGPNAVEEASFDIFPNLMHDAAAVLVRDGQVIAAIEQERLDRIKHSNKRPFDAIRFCLQKAGLTPADVDRFAFYGEQTFWDRLLREYYLLNPGQPQVPDAATLLRLTLQQELGHGVGEGQPVFVGHHLAHAVSATAMSGFDDSLVLVADGQGDEIAGLVLDARGAELNTLETLPVARSLGNLYLRVTELLGYRLFDEYKVMGLAPYGDPGRFRDFFESFYTLLPEGGYDISWEKLRSLIDLLPAGVEPTTQTHKDVAAALQESLEKLVFHVLAHYQKQTGHRNLCLAGGVAHNCTLNGKIMRSGLFDQVFIQPAAHDAGCALGAAIHVHYSETKTWKSVSLPHVYWGSDIGGDGEVERELRLWPSLIDYEKVEDVCTSAAELLSDGKVLGWVQGRSEFGPRALGNRSIVADPRPAENKDLINAMVKKREAFRPFAPSVLEERASEFFDLPPVADRLPFMVVTVDVREEKRPLLGAVTHVDGSARIQTVSRETNECFWRLIQSFGALTGVPVVLNTSFNNNAEPIVDSVRDAVVCFLTTRLDALAVGSFIVKKRTVSWRDFSPLVPALPRFIEMRRILKFVAGGWQEVFELSSPGRRSRSISREAFTLLSRSDGRKTLEDLLSNERGDSGDQSLVEEILELWASRVVTLAPAGT
jgi:carbamoyltransferase